MRFIGEGARRSRDAANKRNWRTDRETWPVAPERRLRGVPRPALRWRSLRLLGLGHRWENATRVRGSRPEPLRDPMQRASWLVREARPRTTEARALLRRKA